MPPTYMVCDVGADDFGDFTRFEANLPFTWNGVRVRFFHDDVLMLTLVDKPRARGDQEDDCDGEAEKVTCLAIMDRDARGPTAPAGGGGAAAAEVPGGRHKNFLRVRAGRSELSLLAAAAAVTATEINICEV